MSQKLPESFTATVSNALTAELEPKLDPMLGVMMSQFLLLEFGPETPNLNCIVQIMDDCPDHGKKFRANVLKAPRLLEPFVISLLEEIA